LRIIFMGTPDFAAKALAVLIDGPHDVVAVYSQPPRPAGRGQAERRSPVHELALTHGIAVHTPAGLKAEDAQAEFFGIGADIAVVAAYGLILPKPILEAPAKGCINIHASLLPRWRGAAPIQRAILAGDEKTGITIMQMDEGLDTGDILAKGEVMIGPTTSCDDLHDHLAALGAGLVAEVLDRLQAGDITATPQAEEGASYAAKLTREEGRLDWRDDAAALARKVRAFSPWPGAWFEVEGTRIKVLDAEVAMEAVDNAQPGMVLDDGLSIACGDGAFRVLRAQREGRKAQDAQDLLRGFSIPAGTRLALPDGDNTEDSR
jgi:methionyl-tRNA formyltransferase